MYAASHSIPTHNVPALVKRLDTLNNKIAKRITGVRPFALVECPTPHFIDGHKVEKSWVSIYGETPKLADWGFIATYNFEKDADGEYVCFCDAMPGTVIGPEHREIEATRCDHCKTCRYRTQSFLVENSTTGERCVVGRSCLKDFTGHKSPQALISWFSSIHSMDGMVDDEFGSARSGSPLPTAWDALEMLEYTACVVRRQGWISRLKAEETFQTTTSGYIAWARGPRPTGSWKGIKEEQARWDEAKKTNVADDTDKAAAQAVLAELAKAEDSDYTAKLKLIAAARVVSDKNLAVWVSAITLYLKAVWANERAERDAKRADAEAAVPNIEAGKQTVVGTILKLEEKVNHFDPYGGTTMKMTVVNEQGQKFWGSLPKKISGAKMGDQIQFDAQVELGDSRVFAFFKRPSKPSILEVA